MLSQRTVGKLQHLLEQMFRRESGGSALTPSACSRLLYEGDVPSELLDYIVATYGWLPAIFVRALHEGHAIAGLRCTRSGNPSVLGTDKHLGDIYLLQFAAVALRRWTELCSENYFRAGDLYTDAATHLIEYLDADGFCWDRNGQNIVGVGGQELSDMLATAVPLDMPVEKGDAGVTPPPSTPKVTSHLRRHVVAKMIALMLTLLVLLASACWAVVSGNSWNRGEKLALAAIALGVLAVIANWLVECGIQINDYPGPIGRA